MAAPDAKKTPAVDAASLVGEVPREAISRGASNARFEPTRGEMTARPDAEE